MKKLEKDKLKTLLEIIGTNPSMQIAHFSSGGDELIDSLHDYCASKGYLYQINAVDRLLYENLKKRFKDVSTTTLVDNFQLKRKSYMKYAKQYDYLFVSIDIEDDFQDIFLKRVHKIILNAGNIIIFIPKGNSEKRYSLIASLEESYFVATSVIDDMFENYDIVISKKMHGWGS